MHSFVGNIVDVETYRAVGSFDFIAVLQLLFSLSRRRNHHRQTYSKYSDQLHRRLPRAVERQRKIKRKRRHEISSVPTSGFLMEMRRLSVQLRCFLTLERTGFCIEQQNPGLGERNTPVNVQQIKSVQNVDNRGDASFKLFKEKQKRKHEKPSVTNAHACSNREVKTSYLLTRFFA